MAGKTDYITHADRWCDVWLVWFVWVDDAYCALERHLGAWRRRGPQPTFTDSEVITVALIIDTWFHGHEALGLAFLRQYHHDLFPHLPSDGWFNTRRTRLGPLIEQIRRVLTDQWGLIDDDPLRVVDSVPIPIMTYARGKRCRTVDGQEYYGVQASGHAKLFGFRLVLSSTPEQVITDWMLVPAAVHDSQTVGAMGTEWAACTVLGDGAFHAPTVTPILDTRAVTMLCPPRRDARSGRWPRALRAAHTRLRRSIETVFSVLTQTFALKRPGSRSLHGLVSRISTRILAYTLSLVTAPFLATLSSGKTPN